MQWKDTTSYQKGKERIPSAWTLYRGEMRLAVVKGHIYYPNVWVLRCEPWFNCHELKGATTAEDAQSAALKLVRAKIDALHAAFVE